MSEQARLDYLWKALAIDPAMEPRRLLELRARWLDRSDDADEPAHHSRNELLELQHDLIGVFWILEPGEVHDRLAAFAHEPDLQRWGDRLVALDDARPAFDALTEDPKVSHLLVRAIHEVAIEPGSRAPVAREARIRQMTPQAATRSARRVRSTHPVVYERVRPFIDQILANHDASRIRQWEIVLLACGAALAVAGVMLAKGWRL